MPRFKVKAGSHRELNADGSYVEYVADDVFDSPANLDEVFAEKFERLADAPAKAEKAKAEKGDK